MRRRLRVGFLLKAGQLQHPDDRRSKISCANVRVSPFFHVRLTSPLGEMEHVDIWNGFVSFRDDVPFSKLNTDKYAKLGASSVRDPQADPPAHPPGRSIPDAGRVVVPMYTQPRVLRTVLKVSLPLMGTSSRLQITRFTHSPLEKRRFRRGLTAHFECSSHIIGEHACILIEGSLYVVNGARSFCYDLQNATQGSRTGLF